MSAKSANRLSFESGLWKLGLARVAGVDEAGRGPLAGPVVAAAVILPQVWQALANLRTRSYRLAMIIIRFPDDQAKRRALGFLPGRYSFKSWASGEMMVPEEALASLANEGISFIAEGPATYDRFAPLRDPAAVAV
jgi:hypothetical protein